MLTLLQIRDFAIVEHVELELRPGFTALTGETGAGKSILVDALLLAVGGRADSGSVRHGAERAEVTAVFDLRGNDAALGWLEEQAIGHDGECVLRRVVGADGRSRAFVNGQAAPLQSLRALGEHLVDVHGQLEFQSLTRRAAQREALDACAGARAEAAAVREAWRAHRELEVERDALVARASDREARLALIEHYVGELEALQAQPGEAASLQQERARMASLGRLAEGTAQVEAALEDEAGGAGPALARALGVLRQLTRLDPALHATERLVDEAAVACREAGADLRRYAASLDADPARQDWLEGRLAAMESAARKHRVEVGELPQLLERLQDERESLAEAGTSLADLERRLEALRQRYEAAARRLGERRRAGAGLLDRRVSELMHELGMPGGRFETAITMPEPPVVSASGHEEIEFLVSANPGQPVRPLSRVASGGELSRISLALQVVTLDAGRRPCLVFDEVDAGIGGAVAEKVGRLLGELATSGQVLCVTHLPQVAAQARQQVRVVKQTDGGTTRTALVALDGAARVEEIARMLGGAQVTDRAREHASEMLGAAGPGPGATPPGRSRSRPADGAGRARGRSGRGGSASGRR